MVVAADRTMVNQCSLKKAFVIVTSVHVYIRYYMCLKFTFFIYHTKGTFVKRFVQKIHY